MRAPLCCGHCRGAEAIRSKQAGLGGIRRLGAAVGTVVVAVGTAVVAVGTASAVVGSAAGAADVPRAFVEIYGMSLGEIPRSF